MTMGKPNLFEDVSPYKLVDIPRMPCLEPLPRQRELTYDPKRRMSSLDTVWVSQSGAIQRRGRAGRVRAGRLLRGVVFCAGLGWPHGANVEGVLKS